MNLAAVQQIAKAVLYEGYLLYPYRPSSVKNRQRWNFGVISPKAYSEAQSGSEACMMQTECLVEGGALTGLEIRVRFLHLVTRTVGELTAPAAEVSPETEFHPVARLEVAGRTYQPWQEAIEREMIVPATHSPALNLAALARNSFSQPFAFPAATQVEELRDPEGKVAGVIRREQSAIQGVVEVASQHLGEGSFRIRVRIRNLSLLSGAEHATREDALLLSLVSAHTVLGVQEGRFVSLLDPPESMREASASCINIGTWPVLVGEEGERDTLLSSPIILYDYPQIAAESAGDLFDGTEIDEILSLRIMTMTDEEKREMSQSDERARQMLERTETLPAEQLMKLHGVLRNLRPAGEKAS